MRAILILVSFLAFSFAEASAKHPRKSDARLTKAVQASTARAIAMFPDYDVEGTRLNQAIQAELQWQKAHNPATLDQPDGPERIAKGCAHCWALSQPDQCRL